jgi:hypothetical protein
MDDFNHRIIKRRDVTRRRLSLVPSPEPVVAPEISSPTTIGRLIAQTALIADSALSFRKHSDDGEQRTKRPGRRFGLF